MAQDQTQILLQGLEPSCMLGWTSSIFSNSKSSVPGPNLCQFTDLSQASCIPFASISSPSLPEIICSGDSNLVRHFQNCMCATSTDLACTLSAQLLSNFPQVGKALCIGD